MRVPVVNVTLYFPGGLGSRYPEVVWTNKGRNIEKIDCMSASVAVSQLECCHWSVVETRVWEAGGVRSRVVQQFEKLFFVFANRCARRFSI